MPQLRGYARRVMNRGQPIRGETVPQTVFRPPRESCHFTNPVEFLSRTRWNDRACHLSIRPKPRREVCLNLDDSSSCTFSFRPFDFDESPNQINLAPLKTFDFGVTESGECTDCKHWDNVRRIRQRSAEQNCQFIN